MKRTGKTKPSKVPTFDTEGYQTNIKDLNGARLPKLGKVKAVSFWGGAREGAGRKASGRQPLLLRLSPQTVRNLRAAARKQGKTISEIAEARLVSA